MLLSKTCGYAIRACVYLAMQSTDGYVPVRTISERLGISFHFLTKILRELTEKGVLDSFRGPNGGVKLVRPPDATTMMDIVLAIDGGRTFTECVLGLAGCGVERPCPVHDQWGAIRERIKREFESVTLSEVATQMTDSGARLVDGGDEGELEI